jgi:short subunit dehydrogenase-like uncharacterized protein
MNTLNDRPAIGIFGAAGHTGRFTVDHLRRRGFTPVSIGRDSQKLAAAGFHQEVALRTASVDDPASLDRALAGIAAVINCAGPFLDTAEVLTAAAVRAGVHYLDVSAEQASAQAVFDKCADDGVVVIPSMAFYGGFADLLATAAMGNWKAADEIRVGIALDSWHPTQGTRNTGKRNTAPRLVIENGKAVPLAPPSEQAFWDFPPPFGRQDVSAVPLSEIPLISRHIPVTSLHSYLNNAPLQDLHDASTPPPVATDAQGRSAQTFLVDVIVRNGDQTRRAIARGQDIYAFTAPLLVEAVNRILNGRVRKTGALAPGEAFDAEDFLRALTPEYLQLTLESQT